MEGESSTFIGENLLAKLTKLGSSEKNFPQFSQQIPHLSQKSKKAQKLHKNEVPFKDLLLDKKNIQATAEISCRRWKVKDRPLNLPWDTKWQKNAMKNICQGKENVCSETKKIPSQYLF